MALTSMQDFLEIVKGKKVVKNVAVPGAADDHVLEAVFEAEKMGLIKAILIDKEDEVKKVLTDLGKNPADYEINNAATPEECGQIAVDLVKEGRANVILKGLLETKDICFFQVPYHLCQLNQKASDRIVHTLPYLQND
jgi:phosphate butyryltransferase